MKAKQDPGLIGPKVSCPLHPLPPPPILAVITSCCSVCVQRSLQTKTMGFLVKIRRN